MIELKSEQNCDPLLDPSTWKRQGYAPVSTSDGSLSLRWMNSPRQEAMHHLGGALSESKYIYARPVKTALTLGARTLTSVGLGLGYNELLSIQAAQQLGLSPLLQIFSYEIDSFLVQILTKGIRAEANKKTEALPLTKSLHELSPLDCARAVIGSIGLNEAELEAVRKAQFESRWRHCGALDTKSLAAIDQPIDLVMFDAFSRNTSPELWASTLLNPLLRKMANHSVFTTYACTSDLKKVLLENGFQVWKRPGFMGKRDSTLAVRGWDLSLFQQEH